MSRYLFIGYAVSKSLNRYRCHATFDESLGYRKFSTWPESATDTKKRRTSVTNVVGLDQVPLL